MNPDLTVPAGLSDGGRQAAETILALLCAEDATYTGGCRLFYTPIEWVERGEQGGRGAVLVVVYDGAAAARYFEYAYEDYAAINRMDEALEALGLYAESIHSWCAAVYSRAPSGAGAAP